MGDDDAGDPWVDRVAMRVPADGGPAHGAKVAPAVERFSGDRWPEPQHELLAVPKADSWDDGEFTWPDGWRRPAPGLGGGNEGAVRCRPEAGAMAGHGRADRGDDPAESPKEDPFQPQGGAAALADALWSAAAAGLSRSTEASLRRQRQELRAQLCAEQARVASLEGEIAWLRQRLERAASLGFDGARAQEVRAAGGGARLSRRDASTQTLRMPCAAAGAGDPAEAAPALADSPGVAAPEAQARSPGRASRRIAGALARVEGRSGAGGAADEVAGGAGAAHWPEGRRQRRNDLVELHWARRGAGAEPAAGAAPQAGAAVEDAASRRVYGPSNMAKRAERRWRRRRSLVPPRHGPPATTGTSAARDGVAEESGDLYDVAGDGVWR